jgi:hypothetical protein
VGLALKVKGQKSTPKAGPKKRRFKSEQEAEKAAIRAAIEEHGKRRPRARRKSSKINSFKYKEASAPAKEKVAGLDPYALREPEGPSLFDVFAVELPDDQRVFAKTYWHMRCEHLYEGVVAGNPSLDGLEPVWKRCADCGLVRRWYGNRTASKRQEWMTYCPDGFDMFDWEHLFTKDRGMWLYIHDECLAEMVDESMTKED